MVKSTSPKAGSPRLARARTAAPDPGGRGLAALFAQRAGRPRTRRAGASRAPARPGSGGGRVIWARSTRARSGAHARPAPRPPRRGRGRRVASRRSPGRAVRQPRSRIFAGAARSGRAARGQPHRRAVQGPAPYPLGSLSTAPSTASVFIFAFVSAHLIGFNRAPSRQP